MPSSLTPRPKPVGGQADIHALKAIYHAGELAAAIIWWEMNSLKARLSSGRQDVQTRWENDNWLLSHSEMKRSGLWVYGDYDVDAAIERIETEADKLKNCWKES